MRPTTLLGSLIILGVIICGLAAVPPLLLTEVSPSQQKASENTLAVALPCIMLLSMFYFVASEENEK